MLTQTQYGVCKTRLGSDSVIALDDMLILLPPESSTPSKRRRDSVCNTFWCFNRAATGDGNQMRSDCCALSPRPSRSSAQRVAIAFEIDTFLANYPHRERWLVERRSPRWKVISYHRLCEALDHWQNVINLYAFPGGETFSTLWLVRGPATNAIRCRRRNFHVTKSARFRATHQPNY